MSLPKVLEFVNTISQTSVGSTKDVNTYVSTNMKLSSTGLRIFSQALRKEIKNEEDVIDRHQCHTDVK